MEEGKRQSKDNKTNKEGRMLEFIEERGFNGKVKGKYTSMGGKGGTVIDYVLGDRKVRDRIEKGREKERRLERSVR